MTTRQKRANPLGGRIKAAMETQWKRRAEAVVCLYLPFPISTNRLWRPVGGTLVCTARYRTWKRAAGNEINRQRPGRIKGTFTARIVLEKRTGRQRIDADNGTKCLLDILQTHGIIENDALATQVSVMFSPAMDGAYVVLTAVASISSPILREERAA